MDHPKSVRSAEPDAVPAGRALKLEPLIATRAKERQREGVEKKLPQNSAEAVETRDELAQVAGVSQDTISKPKVIAAKAPEAVVPEGLPPATERYNVHHGKLTAAGLEVADASVDWIITDPPYGKEHIGLYAELSDFAFRVLKPGGSLICMAGQSYLPEIIEQLGKHLNYHWTLAYLTPDGQSAQLWGRKVNTFWKPLLWYVKGKYEGDWIGDVCRSDSNDKRFHEWGQSESGMADIVDRFTYPGQTICDPFCGGRTTGVVAVRMNRLFVGIDSDAEAVATTLKRLAELASA